jgi:hypothetical protein
MTNTRELIDGQSLMFVVPREHATVYFCPCYGLTNECYLTTGSDISRPKAGDVFFWEYDWTEEKITVNDQTMTFTKLSKSDTINAATELIHDWNQETGLVFCLFETLNGIHIVGFNPLPIQGNFEHSNRHIYLHELEHEISKILPNPLWAQHTYRILRLSRKGIEPEPKFVVAAIDSKYGLPLNTSLGHVLAYSPLIPNNITARLLQSAGIMYPRFVFYMGKVKQPDLLKWVDYDATKTRPQQSMDSEAFSTM